MNHTQIAILFWTVVWSFISIGLIFWAVMPKKTNELYDKFKHKLLHYYFEGLTGELCWKCSGFEEKLKKDLPRIKKMWRDAHGQRYGTPQDYKDAQEFIDSL